MYNFYDFLRGKWREHSDASGQKGTVIDELAVKPAGLIMGEFYNSQVNQRRVNDITKWQTWTEAEMDFFGAKFFLKRIIHPPLVFLYLALNLSAMALLNSQVPFFLLLYLDLPEIHIHENI